MNSVQVPPEVQAPTFGKHLLIGHPNVGKSALFNRLSGSRVTVSNYPGTTVDLEHSLVRLASGWRELVDTPGARSLVAGSEDERVTQRCLLENPGVPVTQVGDAKNLRRTLFLASQLIELEQPQVLALNMVDECRRLEALPDPERLAGALGVPVCLTTAVTGEGVAELERVMESARPGTLRIEYPAPVERAIEEIGARLQDRLLGKRGLALLYLCGDPSIEAWLAERLDPAGREAIAGARARAAAALDEALPLAIHQARYDRVARVADAVLVPHARARALSRALARGGYYFAGLPALGALAGWVLLGLLEFAFLRPWMADGSSLALALPASGAAALGALFLRRGLEHRRRLLTPAESLGELAIQRSTAWPLLGLTLYGAYLIVGVFAAGTCVDFIENRIFASVEGGPGFDVGPFIPASENFTADGEPIGWWLFHVPWKGLNYYLAAAARWAVEPENLVYQLFFGPPPGGGAAGAPASDMGLITVGLTYSIAIILPIVAVFFLVFSLLEDSGFLPRIAVLTDKGLKRIGLNGRAVLPLILGLGCDTMATMTTRILHTRKERMVAILLLALAVPCSAQIGVIAGVMARVSPFALFLFALIILSQLLIVGAVAGRLIKGRASDFMIEIPPVRMPLARNVVMKTVSRMKWFLIEAVPLFLLGTFALFVIQHLGIIPILVDLGRPIVGGLLGLPEGTTLGFLLGFLRRDFGAVHILGSFSDADGAASAAEVRQVLVAVVVITLFIPCLANYFMMVREQGLKVATAMSAFVVPYAIAVGFALNQLLAFVPASWLVRGGS